MLSRLAGAVSPTETLAAQLESWRTLHDEDRRPTALELALHTGRALDLKRSGGWFGGLTALDELDEGETVVFEEIADFLDYVEHGSYTKSYKLVTLRALTEAEGLWEGMDVGQVARISRWIIERDARLRQDLVDGGFASPSRPTVPEWEAYWRRNPINALTKPDRGRDDPWFVLDNDRLVLDVDLPEAWRPDAEALIRELVEYRLHRYLLGRATRRSAEKRHPRDTAGRSLDATFHLEHEADAPIALFWESAGGTAGGPSARNTEYVAALDHVLQRMRTADLVIEDAYVDSTKVSKLPIPDRRLVPGDGLVYPIALTETDDLIGLRRSLLRSMAKVGRKPSAKGGNSRKAMRLVISGADRRSAKDLADQLAGERPSGGDEIGTDLLAGF